MKLMSHFDVPVVSNDICKKVRNWKLNASDKKDVIFLWKNEEQKLIFSTQQTSLIGLSDFYNNFPVQTT